MTKRIPIVKKITSARTIYYKTDTLDTNWVLNQCDDIAKLDDLLKSVSDVELQKLHKKLNRANHNMPTKSKEYGGGYNSVRSMCDGVIDNFKDGQYDLSDPQIKGLVEAFKVAASELNNVEDVEFVEVATLIKTKPLFEVDNEDFKRLFNIP